MQIVKFEGEWVKELPAEGEELSNEWLVKKLAEIESMALGWMYYEGKEVPKDYVEAAKWYRKGR
jgi:TPR repeat protein